jgi:hypothetical protein
MPIQKLKISLKMKKKKEKKKFLEMKKWKN